MDPRACRRGTKPDGAVGVCEREDGLELARYGALRYLQPLREGGSLPAVVATSEGGLHVTKFRGAGQGPKALIAEVVVGLLARALGLPVPELAIVEVPDRFGRSERDPEIRDLLRASHGENVGLRYLDGAFNFAAAAAGDLVDGTFASRLVWLDAYTTNPDRTHGNPNLLVWQRKLWLIDHGSALYAHHDWSAVDAARVRTPFAPIAHHVLLDRADALEAADAELASRITPSLLSAVLSAVPDSLLLGSPDETCTAAAAVRERYRSYLLERLEARSAFVHEAAAARDRARRAPPRRRTARR
jgi:hypothetical protein